MALEDFNPMVVSPILGAIKKAFTVQLSTKTDLESFKPKDICDKVENHIASVISLTGPNFNGTLAILFPEGTFVPLVNRMLGESYQQINPENADAAAEILNIIYGVARPEINKSGFSFAPAIPSVVRGKNVVISHPNTQLVGVIQCRCDLGGFQVELSLKKVA